MPIHSRPTLIGLLLLIAMSTIGTPVSRANHPFHVCIGQMQWNPSNGRWEVSLRMHPRDLELALSDLNRKNISREDPQFPKFAVDYLANQFFLMQNPDSQDLKVIAERISQVDPSRKLDHRSSLEWVGMENERGWLWIHLEMTPPQADPALGPLFLVHRIFLDRIEAQENSVAILHTRTNRSSLQFKRGQIVKPFATPPGGVGFSDRIDTVDIVDGQNQPRQSVNNVRCQSSQHRQHRQHCQHSPKPVPTAARRRASSGRCHRRLAAVLVFATPPGGGGFFDRIDWVDKIDCVDGRQD